MTDRLHAIACGVLLYLPESARNRLKRLDNERGQAFVEYVLLLTVVAIAVALITEWGNFVNAITNALKKIEGVINNPSSGSSSGGS